MPWLAVAMVPGREDVYVHTDDRANERGLRGEQSSSFKIRETFTVTCDGPKKVAGPSLDRPPGCLTRRTLSRDYMISLNATLENWLSRPSASNAVTAKYHVPVPRFSTT